MVLSFLRAYTLCTAGKWFSFCVWSRAASGEQNESRLITIRIFVKTRPVGFRPIPLSHCRVLDNCSIDSAVSR